MNTWVGARMVFRSLKSFEKCALRLSCMIHASSLALMQRDLSDPKDV